MLAAEPDRSRPAKPGFLRVTPRACGPVLPATEPMQPDKESWSSPCWRSPRWRRPNCGSGAGVSACLALLQFRRLSVAYATLSARTLLRPSPGVLRAQLHPVATVLRNGFRSSTLNSRPASAVVLGRSVFGAGTRGFCCSAPEATARRGHICDTLTHVPAALLSLGASDFCHVLCLILR